MFMIYTQNSKKLRCPNSTSPCQRKNSYECQCSQRLLQLLLLLLFFFFLPSERLLNAVNVVNIHPSISSLCEMICSRVWCWSLFVDGWNHLILVQSAFTVIAVRIMSRLLPVMSRAGVGGAAGIRLGEVVGSSSRDLQMTYSTNEMFCELVHETLVPLI